ncbi:MAG TPA: PDZ domain-containing protein [Nitrososphaeraceae archaeon]|nr:PDZ domain-containing protein [Nitrososphaeraceae archaeon]
MSLVDIILSIVCPHINLKYILVHNQFINTITKMNTVAIALLSLQLLLGSLFIAPILANGSSENQLLLPAKFFAPINHTKTILPVANESARSITKMRNFGMWAPYQQPLESIQNTTEQKKAIDAIVKQGYSEYYFALSDFKSKLETSMTENLLQSADGSKLKIIIILLPPSEAGPKGNFDWNGWIGYLNSLKTRHPSSLDGFVIDDFNFFNNFVHTTKQNNNHNNKKNHDDVNNNAIKFPKENVSFMIKSNLEEALQKKRQDLHFYPLLYFEGIKTNDVKRHYYNNTDGIILASTDYYNVTELAHNLNVFSKVFNNKPIRYVVYTARTSTYINQNYSPPSDRLILSTLSIANKSGVVKGIVVWRNTNSPVIRDYLSNMNDTEYLSVVSMMEKLQVKDENISSRYGVYNPFTVSTQQEEQQQSLKRDSDRSTYEKTTEDHNKIISSSPPPRLGISAFDLTPAVAEDMRLPINYKGAVVQSVIVGSPAYKAGIRGTTLDVDQSGYLIRKGDVIISVDGHKINGAKDILRQMKKKQLGDMLTLTVYTNGQIMNLNAKLE